MMDYLPYIVTAASIVGTVANSLQRRWCFYVWICTNAFWCVFNAVHGSYAQALLYAFNFAMAILGLIKWRQRGKEDSMRAERDAAVRDLEQALNDVERIRLSYLVTDFDLDDVLSDVCEKYCRNYGRLCFVHGDDPYSCKNFHWRGGD